MLSDYPDYTKFSDSQLDKIGNTMIYLSGKIDNLSKTKLLKLLYILDELSIKKNGIPFLNLSYKLWRLGPVAEDIFIDLSSKTVLLNKYIEKQTTPEGNTYIRAKTKFADDEFSDNDLELLDYVVSRFGNKTAHELVQYTHRKNSPWYNTAKDNMVLDLLENNRINSTNFVVDMKQIISFDEKRSAIYEDYTEQH